MLGKRSFTAGSRLTTVILLFAVWVFSSPALSNEPAGLEPQEVSKASALLIQRHVQSFYDFSFEAAHVLPVDLNEDGLDEFILTNSQCMESSQICDYYILGRTGKNLTELGHIKAYAVRPGSQYDFGVRQILAYKKPHNDFEFRIYFWNSEKLTYTEKDL